jgi:hypothetical protein
VRSVFYSAIKARQRMSSLTYFRSIGSRFTTGFMPGNPIILRGYMTKKAQDALQVFSPRKKSTYVNGLSSFPNISIVLVP